MPNLADRAPGVYVFEERGTPPIAGVGTSTAAIIGVSNVPANRMPTNPAEPVVDPANPPRFQLAAENDPVQITNFQQFKNSFGDFDEENTVLAHAVFGYFANGGTRCHVVRVADLADLADALDAISRIDEVALVLAPGARTQPAQDAIIDHCSGLDDRFAILDPRDGDGPPTEAAIRDNTKTSDYAAMYFPDIQVADQTPMDGNGNFDPAGRPDPTARLTLPPSAHVAGMYGRVDFNRGVHKAPANETLAAALGVAYQTNAAEQGPLNQVGINVIRNFRGTIRVWGARTLGGPDVNGEFNYINVRRLFLFLKESIDQGTQFAVFEPNSETLWAQITRAVTAFLTIQWRAGALFGSTPDEAFFVQCDRETNPRELQAIGQVNTKIGVAPVFPAEFVVFTISQKTLGAE